MAKNIPPGVDHRRFKDEVYGELARVGSALASPKRLEILDLLAQRDRSVDDLAQEMGISIASASQHLRSLAEARLVTTERTGTFVFYSLADTSVYEMLASLRVVGERRLAEVPAILRRHLGELRSQDDVVPFSEIRDGIDGNAMLLLDVRPAEEFRSAHIAGARSAPVAQLQKAIRNRTLPHNREIVVYCRGPFCVWADEAVAFLRKRGFRARRLELGVLDYEALGFVVEREAKHA